MILSQEPNYISQEITKGSQETFRQATFSRYLARLAIFENMFSWDGVACRVIGYVSDEIPILNPKSRCSRWHSNFLTDLLQEGMSTRYRANVVKWPIQKQMPCCCHGKHCSWPCRARRGTSNSWIQQKETPSLTCRAVVAGVGHWP